MRILPNAVKGSLYGDYTTDKFYIEGIAGYALNKNSTSRNLTFGDMTARGHHDSHPPASGR